MFQFTSKSSSSIFVWSVLGKGRGIQHKTDKLSLSLNNRELPIRNAISANKRILIFCQKGKKMIQNKWVHLRDTLAFFFFFYFLHIPRWLSLFCSSIYHITHPETFSLNCVLLSSFNITSDFISTTSKQVGQGNVHWEEKISCDLCFSKVYSYFLRNFFLWIFWL